MKRVVLLSTGGTIASAPGSDGRAVAGVLSGEDLLAHTGLEGLMEARVESVFQKASNAIGPAQWRQLAEKCAQLIHSKQVDGIVITHGTDTLEDTAYYLHCVLDTSQVPVIVTGSQRVPQAMGSDAYANLRQAMELAASPHARGQGVLVSFNQSVFSAGFVRKVSSYQLNGFDAPGLGPAGMLDEGCFHLLQRPRIQPLLPNPAQLPRVDILPAYGGAEAAMARAVLQSAPDALVVDGLGRGQVPLAWAPVLAEALENGAIIAVCSSTLHGATHESYDYPGSLHELVSAGAFNVSHLSARKARIRLALSMAAYGKDISAIAAAFSW
ncbi:MAG: asparaginase [Alcaligenaceae bacterium]|nr:asparaginase [Alcaligenaceae bacterium]